MAQAGSRETVASEAEWTTVDVVDDGSSISEEEPAEGGLVIENLGPCGVRVSMRFRSAEAASSVS
ncbi:hypothetical protein [Halobaculum rubrum]|uniref:hypothetical protein n=1 Tax=Halobaculum rubrum TaxID=2872158 RepID=UPI001CA40178|nr:hypothetical protein [Halobaculum rubrum]QZX98844.1 hypothetical protein K6T25_11260 [Halobaculum rubrum]